MYLKLKKHCRRTLAHTSCFGAEASAVPRAANAAIVEHTSFQWRTQMRALGSQRAEITLLLDEQN